MRWTLILLVLFPLPHLLSAAEEISRTGTEVKELESFDRHITELMKKYDIPGGTAAVAKDGRLVYARGFGWADQKNHVPMQPTALMRIASVSKPFTATVIMQLIEQGRLKLKDPILPYLKKFGADTEKHLDPRWRQITIEHLLRHTAGFDRNKSFDPMFIPQLPKPPLDQAAIIRYMLGRPLDFDPGTRFVYSNFDYCMLGRVIEAITGKGYEDAVREMVLRPAGITRMKLGRTRRADRAEGEVVYHTLKTDKPGKSVFPEVKELVDEPYGDFYLEALDAHGGWIASAADLVRFAAALDGQRSPRLLKPESIAKNRKSLRSAGLLGKQQERSPVRPRLDHRFAAQGGLLVSRRIVGRHADHADPLPGSHDCRVVQWPDGGYSHVLRGIRTNAVASGR